jgi:hypothetical protein
MGKMSWLQNVKLDDLISYLDRLPVWTSTFPTLLTDIDTRTVHDTIHDTKCDFFYCTPLPNFFGTALTTDSCVTFNTL